jgi:hypothetical protein
MPTNPRPRTPPLIFWIVTGAWLLSTAIAIGVYCLSVQSYADMLLSQP